MSLNNLPSSLQSIVQTGFLERKWQDKLRARLGFRDIAERTRFPNQVGGSVTKTRPGLFPLVTAPLATPANTDFTSGLTPQNFAVEQYTLQIAQYAANAQLNIALTDPIALGSIFVQNAENLAEQATKSVDNLARQCLFDSYMGGNTFVTTTLGSAGTAVHVDDVRGFQQTLNSKGQVVATSSSNQLTVVVGSDSYTLNTVVADGTAPSTISPWLSNLTFSGSSSNSSTVPGGFSGTLTFSANVTTGDATKGNAVTCSIAPAIIRAGGFSTTLGITSSSTLTVQNILTAKADLELNGVKPMPDGDFRLYIDPMQATGLYLDEAFQRFQIGNTSDAEYRQGVIAKLMGVKLVRNNMMPPQTVTTAAGFGVNGIIRRAILCGEGALVEGEFTSSAYAAAEGVDDGDGMMVVVDGIAHIIREPLDALKQVVTQSFSYIGGFSVPTDVTVVPSTLPSATNAAYKRAVIIESV